MTTNTLSPSLLEEEVIEELEMLDALLLQDLLGLYIRESAMHLDALSEALERRDPATVAGVAHKLKGSSRALGATLVAEGADALEESATSGGLVGAAELIDALRHSLDITDDAFRARRGAR